MLMGNFIFGCQDAGTACPEWWSLYTYEAWGGLICPVRWGLGHMWYPLGHGYVERLISLRRAWWNQGVSACVPEEISMGSGKLRPSPLGMMRSRLVRERGP